MRSNVFSRAMASKLFHAVVGFGIALGGAAACVSASDPGAPSLMTGDSGTTTSTEADAAARDGAADVGADAFCDVAWPTTKGSVPVVPECVDPEGDCADAGAPTQCAKSVDGGGCDHDQTYFSVCKAGTWECAPGRTPIAQCP